MRERTLCGRRSGSLGWWVVPVLFLLAGSSWAGAPVGTLCCTVREPIPWGQLAFTPGGELLLPVAHVVTLSEEELRQERERRQKWLERPIEEQVDELVRREPGEDERIYRFRRWIAKRYLEGIRKDPEAALPEKVQRVREVELRVLRPTSSGLEAVARLSLWQGDVDVSTEVSHFGGQTLTKRLINVWAGAVVGERWIAAWARVYAARQGWSYTDVALLLDGRDPKRWRPLGAVHPLLWTAPERLLVIVQREGHPTLAELELDAEGKVRQERLLDRAPSHRLTATPIPGTRKVLLKQGFVAYLLDLETGKVGRQLQTLQAGQAEIKVPLWTPVLAHAGSLWVVDRLQSRFYQIASKNGALHVVSSLKLPRRTGEDFWGGPLVPVGEGFMVVREKQLRRRLSQKATSGTTTGWFGLWWVKPADPRSLRPLSLPDIKIDAETQPAAVSPDGRWLALRVDENTVQVWKLGD